MSIICEGILEGYSRIHGIAYVQGIRFWNAERHSGKNREHNKATPFNKQIRALTNIEHPYRRLNQIREDKKTKTTRHDDRSSKMKERSFR